MVKLHQQRYLLLNLKQNTVEPPKPKPAPKKAQPKETQPAVTEVSRTARTRDDGTQYFEVEYSDGSMEDINAQSSVGKQDILIKMKNTQNNFIEGIEQSIAKKITAEVKSSKIKVQIKNIIVLLIMGMDLGKFFELH